jgi:hypothetical protein
MPPACAFFVLSAFAREGARATYGYERSLLFVGRFFLVVRVIDVAVEVGFLTRGKTPEDASWFDWLLAIDTKILLSLFPHRRTPFLVWPYWAKPYTVRESCV